MKKLLHFILSHSIFISLCAAGLSLQTLQLLSLPVNLSLLIFLFFATLGGYNAYWIFSKFSLNTGQSITAFVKKQAVSLLIVLIAFTGMVYCLLHLHLILYNLLITFLLLLLYAVPLLPFEKIHFTRRAGFVKTVLLSLTWTHVTTMIPLQKTIAAMNDTEALIYFNRFLFMLMLCTIFDKRDAAMDQIRGMHSLATDMSSTMLHVAMLVVFMLFEATSVTLFMVHVPWRPAAGLVVMGWITALVYLLSLRRRGYFFYYFLVDGLMLFSALVTCLLSI